MGSNVNLGADIYSVTDVVNDLKKDYFPANEDSLMIGMPGYIGSLFAKEWQNNIIMTSQYANESIPTKAQFERNVLTHALMLEYISVTATPAVMEVQLCFLERDIVANLNSNGQFIFDSSTPIMVENFEFHADYDIIIDRTIISGSNYVYTARYVEIGTNPVSDLTNPYLKPPVVMSINGANYIIFSAKLRQVAMVDIEHKVISSNDIENKTFTFTFEDQLASFELSVIEGDNEYKITPIYEGLDNPSAEYFCYYSYLSADTIRIKFTSESYIPKINCTVDVKLRTCQGAAGVFKYTTDLYIKAASDVYGYSNVTFVVRPALDNTYGGIDRKSVSELKRLIPKESLSRGSISTAADLNNYFDLINSTDSKLYFYKKIDNQFTRLHYSYFIMRDDDGNIIPTNTTAAKLRLGSAGNPVDFDIETDTKLILNPGAILKMNKGTGYCERVSEVGADTDTEFYYTTPFMLVVNKNPGPYSSFDLTIINKSKNLEFTYVNQDSEIQYIGSYVDWIRPYSDIATERNTYTITASFVQNIMSDQGVVVEDPDNPGTFTTTNIKAIMVMYNEEGVPYRYKNLALNAYDADNFVFTFVGEMTTTDSMTVDNRIHIDGVCNIGGTTEEYGEFVNNPSAAIFILVKYPNGVEYGRGNEIDSIVPSLTGWTLSNKYTVQDGIDFFFNYSDIISSAISITQEVVEGETVQFANITEFPLVKYQYMSNLQFMYQFIDQIELKREYIAGIADQLDGGFGIDVKFYNTYGPSHVYRIDNGALLDKVNVNMSFRIKILEGADKYIKDYIIQDIKEYVENIEDIKSVHMPNITTLIEKKYADQIVYLQFVGLNEYPTNIQHITISDNINYTTTVPELMNIELNSDGTPNIMITADA